MIRRGIERGIVVFSWACGLVLIAALGFTLAFLLVRGLPSVNWSLIFGDTPAIEALLLRRQVFDGLFPALAGTLLLIFLAMAMALPVGIAAGIFMAEYARGWLKGLLTLVFDVLAGLPSIVVGLAGLSLTLFLHGRYPGRIGPCLLIAALALAFLVLPYLIRSTQSALESLDPLLRRTAPALGASKLQNILLVLLPESSTALCGGAILAIGRAAEDTAVIMLTGVVASAGIPRSVFDQFEALPFTIFYISSQYSDPQELSSGFGAALILLFLCSLLFLLALVIRRRFSEQLFLR